MANIQTGKAYVTQITVIECEPGKQAEALSLMTERGPRYGAPVRLHLH